jgi:alpha-ribazole phosphatase
MRKLYLIRHPAVAVPSGICYGRSDVPLRASAAQHADRLRPSLPLDTPIISSPLSRCRLLAEELARALNTSAPHAPILDARLAEMDFGDWEGLPFDSLPRDLLDAWARNPLGFNVPGGESGAQVIARVLAALDEMLAANASLVIVAHGGPLRIIAGHLLGLPREQWLQYDMPIGALRVLAKENTSCGGWSASEAPCPAQA